MRTSSKRPTGGGDLMATLLMPTPGVAMRAVLAATLLMPAIGAALPAAPPPEQSSPPAPHQQLEAAANGDLASLAKALPRMSVDWVNLAQARLAAGRLQEGKAIEYATAFLSRRDDSSCDSLLAQAVVADAAFASARYALAATASRKRLQLLNDCRGSVVDIESAATMEGLAARLADAPTQHTVTYFPETAHYLRDKAGLQRSTVSINGHAQEAVLDTGANLSVVSSSTADRLGLRMLGDASVGSSSRARVATKVAVADKLEFAGLILENVVFLVLDDAQLEMPLPGGYRIEAIVGFPVFRALRRVRFEHDGRLVPEPVAGDDTTQSNLALAGSDLFVDVKVGGVHVPLHLDSGGSASSLASSFARANPHALDGLTTSRQQLAGAGGTTEREVAVWPDARMEVAGRAVVLPQLPVVVRDSTDAKPLGQGLLGSDVLNQFVHWTLDLERMRLELGAPLKR